MNILKNIKIHPTVLALFITFISLPAAAQVSNPDTVLQEKYRSSFDTLMRCGEKSDPKTFESTFRNPENCAGGSQDASRRSTQACNSSEDRKINPAEAPSEETACEAGRRYGIEELQSREYRLSGPAVYTCPSDVPSPQVNPAKTPQNKNTQPQDTKNREKKWLSKEEIENQKIAFFTKELDLTPQEAAKFWPLYYQSWDERTSARTETMRNLRKLNEALKADPPKSETEIKSLVDAYLTSYRKECALIPKYFTEFSKVLPLRKTAKIFHAEENFRIMLIRQLRHNH